jgi:2-polyprenyl-6-methoxyphenol hydroxylase-like FAD-dependent oxidoreductase
MRSRSAPISVRSRSPTARCSWCRFAIGADGRKSKLRETIGIDTRNWSYPQSAMVLNFAHSLPHENISTEFHTESGPFTQVPLPGQSLQPRLGPEPV